MLLITSSCSGLQYGNKKIINKENIKLVNSTGNISEVIDLLGKPSRIYKESGSEIYEFEYHKLSKSPVYYIPMISAVYNAFGNGIFSMRPKVKTTIKHNYIFITADNDGSILDKKIFVESSGAKVYELICTQNSYGHHSCVDPITRTF